MAKQLIINRTPSETRIGLLEGGRLAELWLERDDDQGIVGNIYLGVVTRVLAGIQSAFVHIGGKRSAFLFAGDVLIPGRSEMTSMPPVPIQHSLREGQRILVQVTKDTLGSKGPRVSMFVSIPGRYLVLTPFMNNVGISRRIEDEEERNRLKTSLEKIKNPALGLISRTGSVGVADEMLRQDLQTLETTWERIEEKVRLSGPGIIFHDLDFVTKTIRDLQSDNLEVIVIDDAETVARLRHTMGGAGSDEEIADPEVANPRSYRLVLHDEITPIFDKYGIEIDIAEALGSRIELPSGGSIVIEQTEALTAFDVNTGKFVGAASARQTILTTNLEAVRHIVRQIRVRNIGGIIVIDFIDMDAADGVLVRQALEDELKQDRAKTHVLPVSEIGLVEMTRKRTRDSLERRLTDICPTCNGRGRVRSLATEALDLIREIERHHIQTGRQQIRVRASEDIRACLLETYAESFARLQSKFHLAVDFETVEGYPLARDSFEIL